MAAITAQLETIRGEQAPAERFDSRKHGLPETGNFRRKQGDERMTTAAVFGTGSWGTAYASVLADGGTTVRMWGRRQEVVDQINAGCNTDYLPNLALLVRRSRPPTTPPRRLMARTSSSWRCPSQTLRANLGDSGVPPSVTRRRWCR